MSFKILSKTFLLTLVTSFVSAGTVDQAQSMLNRLGYNAGPVDGAYGTKTRGALETFYTDNGQVFDGKLSENEIEDLKRAVSLHVKLDSENATQNMANDNGTHYRKRYKINGKYPVPLKSTTSPKNGAEGQRSYEFRTRLNSFMTNFYAVGDFNNDGVQDFIVTAFRNDEHEVEKVYKGVNVYKHKISKHRSFKVYAGDPRTGWGNTYYRKGGKDITHLFVEDEMMSGIADNQIQNQLPLVADFNGDGIDDLYISSAFHTTTSAGLKHNSKFFGGWHSYYLSQQDGTFKESSRDMMKGLFVDKNSGRYTEFSHRSDIGDIDGDGDIDVVHTSVSWKNNNGYIICMYNDGKGNLTSKQCGEQWGNNVKIGDFNGDGNADLLAITSYHKCINQHGKGKLQNVSSSRNQPRVIFGNGSGKFYNRQSKKFIGYGKHQMANGEDILLCGMPTAVVADVDNDGDLDIIGNTIGYLYVGGYFQVFLNDGSGNFSYGQQILGKQPNVRYSLSNWVDHESNHSCQGYCWNIHTIDLNEDGYVDFMCDGGFFQSVDGKVYINNGDGSYKEAPTWMINKHVSVF